MVFESLVVELMNKYLGAYIENLDSSQLSIGIWGGDVVLENLHVKGDALKDLDLPVQIKSGFIGKLTLKIPWKNLYKAPVEATLNGLYLLAMPNAASQYDHKKEKENTQAEKQAQLQAIEEQLLKKSESKTGDKQDGFVEKLATQIIKNLQIDIQNIHIRYEDNTTIKGRPFAFGVTLSRLSLQTTDEHWIPCILDEAAKIIYKMVNLRSLSVYWNANPQKMFSQCPREEQLELFKNLITKTDYYAVDLAYIIKPISLEAKLRLNPHPLNDLDNPKILLGMVFNEIGLNLSHTQYHGIMELVESMDRMSINEPFRKFKPNAGVKSNSKEWWKYAYNCILQSEVKRKVSLFSWQDIKKHRDKLKTYKKLYKQKLVEKKPSTKLVDQLIEMENDIDVFNITLARQAAEAEMVKTGVIIKSKKSRHQKEESSGWFGGWFGGGKKKEVSKEESENKIDQAMTEKEKKLLYEAIDYSEGDTATDENLPQTYVENKFDISLQKISVNLVDDRNLPETSLIHLESNNIETKVAMRPSAKAILLELTMKEFAINGLPQKDSIPQLVTSKVGSSSSTGSLLAIKFETNPLNETCDQKIVVRSEPLQMTYDACTINILLGFIQPPKDVQFQQIKAIAADTYDDIKVQTATGLKHAMASRKVTDIDIHLMSSYVVVPHSGLYKSGCAALIVDLGEVSLKSVSDDTNNKSSDIDVIRSQAYDRFMVNVDNIQVLLASQNGDWETARSLATSSMHLLEPLNISILLEKCIIANDAALPKLKVSGDLPLVSLRLTDKQIQNAMSLVKSIPLPPSESNDTVVDSNNFEFIPLEPSRSQRRADLNIVTSTFEDDFGSSKSLSSSGAGSMAEDEFFTADSDFSDSEEHLLTKMQNKKREREAENAHAQLTDVIASFVINKILISLGENVDGKDNEIIQLSIDQFGVLATVRTWDTSVNAYLGAISLQYMPASLYVIKTPLEMEKKLLTIDIILAKKTCPDFVEMYNNIEQNLKVKFTALELNMHSNALLQIKNFSQKIIPDKKIEEEATATVSSEEIVPIKSESFLTAQGSDSSDSTAANPLVIKHDITNVALIAELDSFIINILDEQNQIASVAIQGITVNINVKPKTTSIAFKLQNLLVIDPFVNTQYHEIVTAVGGDVLSADVVVFTNNTLGEDYKDMELVDTSVKVKFGSMRVVFIKRFVDCLVTYTSQFQDAKAIAAQAGSMAQEAAVAQAKKLAERNPRIMLDIMLTVPNIIIPRNSMSLEVLAADLGNVRVKNSFEILGAEDTDIPAVADNMTVDVMDIKLSICTLDEAKSMNSEYQILEPVSLNLSLKRNLAASWYHEVPDITIGGNLPTIGMKISSADISAILKTLDENLSEAPQPVIPVIEEIVTTSEAIEIEAKISSSSSMTSTLKEEPLASKNAEAVWNTLKIQFSIDSLKLNVFADKQREFPFAKFSIQTINLAIDQRSDSSQDITASLSDILLEDLRMTHRGQITKYIERKSASGSNHTVNAQVKKLSDGSMNIKASVSSLSIILCVEFLVKLGDIFTKALQKPKEEPKTDAKIIEEDSFEDKPKSHDAVQEEVKTPIHLEFVLHRPDIVLVTDLKSETAEAIVLGLKLQVIFNTSAESSEQRLAANLSDLQINSCAFNEIGNLALDDVKERKRVLSPCDIDVNGVLSDVKQEFFIEISKIRVIASPIVINTLAEAAAMLGSSTTTETAVTTTAKQSVNLLRTKFTVKDKSFWFIDQAEDILREEKEAAEPALLKTASKLPHRHETSETLRLKAPDIRIQLEAGEGHHSIPLLIIQIGVCVEVNNWSLGEMRASTSLSLGVVYFNEALSVWEPLVEPVETNPGFSNSNYKLWELTASVKQNKESENENVEDLPALMEIDVISKNMLHTTITRAALKAINGLGKAFSDAALAKTTSSPSTSKQHNTKTNISASIKINNILGRELNITIGKALEVIGGANKMSEYEYVLKDGNTLYCDFYQQEFADIWALLENQAKNKIDSVVQIRLPGQQDYGLLDISKTGMSYHSLSDGKKTISIICSIESKGGVRKVSLKSCLSIHNQLLDKIQLINETGGIIGIVDPERNFPIPHNFVEDGKKLFLRPFGNEIAVGKAQVVIDKKSFAERIRFNPAKNDSTPIYINVKTTTNEIGSSEANTGSYTVITCKPSVVLKNFLPFPVDFAAMGVGLIKKHRVLTAGHSIQVYDAEVGRGKVQITLKDYRGSDWVGSVPVADGLVELSDWNFENKKVKENFLTLAKQVTYTDDIMVITLYSPYWMVNETDQTLAYKGSDDNIIVHPAEKSGIALFAYNSKSFLSKQSLNLCVNKSDYSDKFSIDAVGSNGTIICKTKDFNYMIGTNIALSSFGLTKIVTFKNYFTLHNTSALDLEVGEENLPRFVNLQSNSSLKFWPESNDESLKVRIRDEPETTSIDFRFRKLESGLLLKLGNNSFVFVDVTVTEYSVTVTFKDYYPGASAVMVVNHTSTSIFTVTQNKVDAEKVIVKPTEVVHYLWPKPLKKRLLSWEVDNNKPTNLDVFQESAGTIKRNDKLTIHWALFLDGMQRVLIFTEDETVSKVVQQGLSTERSNMDVSLSLQGFSLSIVDTKLRRDIMYCAITSSGIIWEEKPKKRWKALPLKYATTLEEYYQKHGEKSSSSRSSALIAKEKYEFDMANMKSVKPYQAEIRRYFSPGIWAQYTVSNHQTLIHIKMNKVQVDNQLTAAVFPVVLHPIPLPQTVAIDSSPKPFVEVSMMTRKSEHQSFTHVKYFKVLIQEFSVKLDMGFISALLPVFGADQVKFNPDKELTYFTNDVSYALKRETVEEIAQASAITFYDDLHLSPIKLHVSFSMQNNCFNADETTSIVELPFNAFSAILKSVGVTLSDIDDVVFKLGYFERFYQFFSQTQFTNSVTMHYAGQGIKQMYVLVLGLDVIGNPYGLVMGIAEGVTDMFYEPYQGMIQGPGEFVEGLALGARSLLGHTVGGAAGAVSRVTGALGKGLATMTMDDEYKKKRQMEKNKQPADLKEGLARGGKGLVMGVVGGLTGVITKPVEGAKNEGAAGFFKGVGKGLVGIVARPASGIIDLASNTFEGIQSLADMSEEVRKMRPARSFSNKTGILQPYSLKRAQGNAMLIDLEKGIYSDTQLYVNHVALDKNKKSFLILTHKMILEAHTGEIFGQWNSGWKFEYGEIIEEPHMTADGIKIVTAKQKHKLFGKSSNGMTISFYDSESAKQVLERTRKDWNNTPRFQRQDSASKEKHGIRFSFKKQKH